MPAILFSRFIKEWGKEHKIDFAASLQHCFLSILNAFIRALHDWHALYFPSSSFQFSIHRLADQQNGKSQIAKKYCSLTLMANQLPSDLSVNDRTEKDKKPENVDLLLPTVTSNITRTAIPLSPKTTELPMLDCLEEKEARSQKLALGEKSLFILVAEDNLVNQMLVTQLLSSWGHRFLLANNGREAVALYQKECFDVVLMDIQMPLMSGLETTRAIRVYAAKTGRHVPVVAMTASTKRYSRDACVTAGMDYYLSKPFRKQALYNLLQHIALQQWISPSEFNYGCALQEADQEILELIADYFLLQTPQDIQNLKQAWQEQDFETAQCLAHSMKGLFLMFGATPLARLSQAILVQLRSKKLDNVPHLMDKFEREFAVFAPFIAQWITAYETKRRQ